MVRTARSSTQSKDDDLARIPVMPSPDNKNGTYSAVLEKSLIVYFSQT